MHSGNNAINFLALQAKELDIAESSHWRKYHSDFSFEKGWPEGIQGFGGNDKPYRGLRKLAVNFLQEKFRKIGRKYKEFKKIDRLAKNILKKQNRAYDLDVLRQVITLSMLSEKVPLSISDEIKSVCIIGDGFASMTSLLLSSQKTQSVILVNLTKTLLVDLYYLRMWLGKSAFDKSVKLAISKEDILDIVKQSDSEYSGLYKVIAIQAENHELIQSLPVDLVINIASMQEMNPDHIEQYFVDMRKISQMRDLYFYCCNRERKVLPDGTVTSFANYPWSDNDLVHIDELCPWHQKYYSLRPPFYRKYDGPIRHRLVKLAPG